MFGSESKEKNLLQDVLTRKTKVKFRINNSDTWYVTTAENINGNEVLLAFPEMFAAIDVVLGEIVTCRFNKGTCQYTVEGRIESITIYPLQIIKLKILGEVKRLEHKEEAGRENVIFLANVFTKASSSGLYACVREISGTGIKLISKYYINVDEDKEVDVHFALPLRGIFDSIVKLKGKVTSTNPMHKHYEYEIDIVQMEEMYKSRVRRFLETYESCVSIV